MRDTLILAVIIIGIGLGWSYSTREQASLEASNLSGNDLASSHPSLISDAQQGATDETRHQKRTGTPKSLRKDERSSGDFEEAEKLTSIYSQHDKERQSVKKVQKKSLKIAGVPIEAYVHSKRNDVGLPAMPERTDTKLRVMVSCLELKREEFDRMERSECSSILARQREMADRSGAAFR